MSNRRIKKSMFKQFHKKQNKSIAEDIYSMIYFLKHEAIDWDRLKTLIFGGKNGKTK